MKRPNRSRVVGYIPRGKESFELAAVDVMTLSATMPSFFVGTGLQVDFNASDVGQGSFSLWLTLADAKALVAHMSDRIGEVESWTTGVTT